MPALQSRQTVGWRRIAQHLERHHRGQGHQLLDELFLQRGVARLIPQQEVIVDGVQPGGTGIADPARLHGSGLACEQRQAVVGGVAGKVDENIDAIGNDQPRSGSIVERMDVPPHDEPITQTSADLILAGIVAVSVQVQLAALQMLQDRFEKGRHRMLAQIAGYEADTQHPLRVSHIGMLRYARSPEALGTQTETTVLRHHIRHWRRSVVKQAKQ